MASTQKLTELPTIQYTGMDYSTVISQIKDIINNNPNWSSNWTQFYSSEAGTLLVQLMAWICDNLAVRQDLLYNESFLATAKNDASKLRLLNQLKYDMKNSTSAKVELELILQKPAGSEINLSCYGYEEAKNKDENKVLTEKEMELLAIRAIKKSIFSFSAPNVNDVPTNWEILNVNSDGSINYKSSVTLESGSIEYDTYKEADAYKKIIAVQGQTKYKEFSSDTSDGPVFELESDIDLNTLTIYDLSGNNYKKTQNAFKNGEEHVRVDNFVDITTIKNDTPCYTVERNDDGILQIRYPSANLCENNTMLENHKFKAGHTIAVFYHISNGSEGNVNENIFNVKTKFTGSDGKGIDAIITNISKGYAGSDKENIDDAVKNAPLMLRTLNRAVTYSDYDVILKNNDYVLNCKSFTPDNMPEFFSTFYGRSIHPHEVFSVVELNKNFKNIPVEYLNSYPWLDSVKNHAINEEVSFSEYKFSDNVDVDTNSYYGAYIKDNYARSFRTNADGGDVIIEKQLALAEDDYNDENETRLKRNLTIVKSGSNLANAVANEKSSYAAIEEDSDDTESIFQLMVKLNNSYYDGNNFSSIENSFFNDETKYLKVNNNVIKENKNACFNSNNVYKKITTSISDEVSIDTGMYGEINLTKATKPIAIVIDDNVKLEIDFQKIIKEDFFEFYKVITNQTELNISCEEFYRINDSIITAALDGNNGFYNIPAENSEAVGTGINRYGKLGIKTHENTDIEKIIYFYSSITGSIGSSFKVFRTDTETEVSFENYVDNILQCKKGFVDIINEEYKKYLKATEVAKLNETADEAKIRALQLNNWSNEQVLNTFHGIMYKDIGLDIPSNWENDDAKKIPNLEYGFYKLKINDEIYCFKVDANTIEKCSEFYEKYGNLYYKYIGRGELSSLPVDSDGNIILEKETLEEIVNIWGGANIYQSEEGKYFTKDKDENIFTLSSNNEVVWNATNLAAYLNYVFSPFNMDEGILYILLKDSHTLVDIKESENKEIYNIHISNVKKDYHKYNSLNKYTFKTETYLSNNGIMEDLRFEYIDPENINSWSFGSINSKDEKYFTIGTDNETNDFEITTKLNYITKDNDNNEITNTIACDAIKDFFYCLLGYKREFEAELPPTDIKIAEMNNDTTEDGYARVSIKSPRTGKSSSIYFEINNGSNNNDNSDSNSNITPNSLINNTILGCMGISLSIPENLIYQNASSNSNTASIKYYTNKAYGEKEMELVVDILKKSNEIFQVDIAEKESETTTISIGDILLTDNDLNMTNVKYVQNAYLSYILTETERVELKYQNNFYYSEDEEVTEKMRPIVAGLEGQVVTKDDDGEYKIDVKASNYKLVMTNDKVDTNNFYCIDESVETLNSVKSRNFSLTTMPIIKTAEYDSYGDDFGSANLIFCIDETADTKETNYVTLNISNGDSVDYIVDELRNFMATEDYIYLKERNYIVRPKDGSLASIVISNIDNRPDGNITFHAKRSGDTTVNTEELKKLYKMLFGTSKTNKEFYTLYPKDVMVALNNNNSSIVAYEDGGYYYYPSDTLVFKFRAFTDETKKESKYPDYYIDCEGNKFHEANVTDDSTAYKFSLVKTETSNLPSGKFYIHYINDRTYETNRDTDEDVLNNYMNKYIISGTTIKYIKPYFKTFDIAGVVYYNGSYEVDTVKKSVENALKNRYGVDNLKNIDIGNKIYFSDVSKLITNLSGVEHVEITYFGLDASNKSTYPSTYKYLSLDGKQDFYTSILLAETEGVHGIQLAYEVASD